MPRWTMLASCAAYESASKAARDHRRVGVLPRKRDDRVRGYKTMDFQPNGTGNEYGGQFVVRRAIDVYHQEVGFRAGMASD